MKFWLGIVQREHVERGVALGIAQTNHGTPSGLRRMTPGDGLVYYSPKTSYPDGAPLREFTAIGTIDDEPPWQADEGDRHPWRRRASYVDGARSVPITPLLDQLDFTRGNSNWGFILRRGLVEMTEHDFRLIASEMGADSLGG